jgi:hypothetical protein
MVAHKDSTHYVLNLSTLHNYEYIRKCLPRLFPPPKIYFTDHRSRHLEMAAQLHDKKKQAQEAKDLGERVVMGRATGATDSQSQALSTSMETLLPLSQRVSDISNPQARTPISNSGAAPSMADTDSVLLESHIHSQLYAPQPELLSVYEEL